MDRIRREPRHLDIRDVNRATFRIRYAVLTLLLSPVRIALSMLLYGAGDLPVRGLPVPR
jgi:hypothetical protein